LARFCPRWAPSASHARARDGKTLTPDDQLQLEDGDTLVLSGQAEALARAEEALLRG